jgi:hypothetical protein
VKAYTTMLTNMHHPLNSICGFFCYRLLTKYVNTATTQSMATAKFHGVMKSVINAKVQHQDQGGTCDGRGRRPAATSQQAAGPADRIECCRLTTCAPLHTSRHYLSGSVHQLTHVHDHVGIEQALHAVTKKIYEA